MKILLANLPWVDEREVYGLRAGSRWPHLRSKKELPYFPFPFSLAYSAAVLKEEGHNIILKDCIAEGKKSYYLMRLIEDEKPEVVVFETSTPSIKNDLSFTKKVKEKNSKTITILCGPHVTALPNESLKESYVDYVLLGEYEYTLKNLVNALKNKKDVNKIKGICSKKGRKIIINQRAPLITELDNLPFPLRKNMPMKKYIDPFCRYIPNAQMITSRGCPYSCIYCLEPWVFSNKSNYRTRTAKNVVDEMEFLIKNYKVREIYFDDSSFSVDQKRVLDICNEINKRGLNINWSCMADAKLKEETLTAMKSAGCISLKFGVESADQEILRNINKHISLDDVRNLVKLCKEIGIETHATYMFGLPGETKESIKKTKEFAFKLKTDTAQFSVAIPFPGTPFYNMARKNRWLITDNWDKFQGTEHVLKYPDITFEEIIDTVKKCKKKIMLKVALNPKQAYRYLAAIYRYSGPMGLISETFNKIIYLIKR